MTDSKYIDTYMRGLVRMFVGKVSLPDNYTEPPDRILSKEEKESRIEEKVLNRAEYRRRLDLFNKGDYSLANEPFRGKLTDPATVSSSKRKAYLERLDSLKNESNMMMKGDEVRKEANEALKKKVDAEFTPKMIRIATHRNVARIRKAQARRKKIRQTKGPGK